MKTVILCFAALLLWQSALAQRACGYTEYTSLRLSQHPELLNETEAVEQFISQYSASQSASRSSHGQIIRVPVVVHILYHYDSEKLQDEIVHRQIEALNRDFRLHNSDTTKIPAGFKSLAADTEIEFVLARTDPKGRATTGIVRKYTPITKWNMDDDIKSSEKMGDDPWDPASYLNIWVGRLNRIDGWSSMPGDGTVDGIVLTTSVFGKQLARTAVHEVGHWLGLRHLWGDQECGDDYVHDTPKQRGFTPGCPSGVRKSCGNTSLGDMYMNYMDFTSDACVVMFTKGQKQRMRAMFAEGGPRHAMLSSKALDDPLIDEIPVEDEGPNWLEFRIYPNPATNMLRLNFEYDARWVGCELSVISSTGRTEMRQTVKSALMELNISALTPGVYFLRAQKEGEFLMKKFVKM